ncbi:MAG TPA: hypothetical protein VKR06_24135 [Ktedonosporobacter sp.]|nr:hypothetical protein [Ktedonosporobacter sp.]
MTINGPSYRMKDRLAETTALGVQAEPAQSETGGKSVGVALTGEKSRRR